MAKITGETVVPVLTPEGETVVDIDKVLQDAKEIPLSVLRELYNDAGNMGANTKKIRAATSMGIGDAFHLAKEIRNRVLHNAPGLVEPRWRVQK